MDSEPAGIVGAIQTFAIAVMALIVATGWVDEEIAGLILGIVAAGTGLGALLIRSRVWSKKSVNALLDAQPVVLVQPPPPA